MGVIENLKRVSLYIGIFLCSLIIPMLYEFLKEKGIPFWILAVFLFIVFAIMVEIITNVFRIVVNRSSFVRRIILGSDYIEGAWIDCAMDNGSKTFGIYTIRYANNSYQIVGNEYDSNCQILYNWRSTTSNFDGNNLMYLYSSKSQGNVEENYGVTSITFDRVTPNQRPQKANGYFIDAATKFRKRTTYAEKLDKYDQIKISSLLGTKEVIRKWVSKVSN